MSVPQSLTMQASSSADGDNAFDNGWHYKSNNGGGKGNNDTTLLIVGFVSLIAGFVLAKAVG